MFQNIAWSLAQVSMCSDYFMTGTPEGSTESSLIHFQKKLFCGFSMGSNQYWAVRVYDMCVYHMIWVIGTRIIS